MARVAAMALVPGVVVHPAVPLLMPVLRLVAFVLRCAVVVTMLVSRAPDIMRSTVIHKGGLCCRGKLHRSSVQFVRGASRFRYDDPHGGLWHPTPQVVQPLRTVRIRRAADDQQIGGRRSGHHWPSPPSELRLDLDT